MESSVLLSLLVLSLLLVNVQGPALTDWFFPQRCPRIQGNCEFKERDECSKNKKCPKHEKCCFFSCGRKCLNLQQVSLQTYAACPKKLAPAWLFSIVGGMIRQIILAPASSMVVVEETITISNPKPCARAPALQRALIRECERIHCSCHRDSVYDQALSMWLQMIQAGFHCSTSSVPRP
ncbi:eppin-like isoform X2 [Bos indicus]|uniref:Eppin-like isoform X2 n=1 Tax=Bos indicus TaxID=9915 RepID=A0ABM4TCV3_BOSIN